MFIYKWNICRHIQLKCTCTTITRQLLIYLIPFYCAFLWDVDYGHDIYPHIISNDCGSAEITTVATK